MAKFNFNEAGMTSGKKEYKVNFFSLKNDGDSTLVRFPYKSTDEFYIESVHTIQVGNYFRDVACLREPNDSVDDCPLCANGTSVTTRFYCHLIEYVTDENGNVVPKARVWKRSLSFARELAGFIKTYGDLSNIVFSVTRKGKKGDMKTTYQLVPMMPQMCDEKIYVKDFSDFNDYKDEEHSFVVKTREEMNEFLKTGEFPRVERNVAPKANSYTNTIPTTSTNIHLDNDGTLASSGTIDARSYQRADSSYQSQTARPANDNYYQPQSTTATRPTMNDDNRAVRPVRYNYN